MDKKQLKKDWLNFLIDINKNGTDIAKDIGTTQQNLNQKINNGSIKYIELSAIVEKYGYSVKIHKGDTDNK